MSRHQKGSPRRAGRSACTQRHLDLPTLRVSRRQGVSLLQIRVDLTGAVLSTAGRATIDQNASSM